MPNVEKVKAGLLDKVVKSHIIKDKDLLSTGSVLVDLSLSGRVAGGIPKGTLVSLAGDSDSGKTWLAKSILAEAANNPRFEKYRLIYDGPEYGALMNDRKFFGNKLVERLEGRMSQTVQDFFYGTDDDFKEGKPFVKVLDSFDALTSEEEVEKFAKKKEASRKGKEISGSYGTSKPKEASANLRVIANECARTGSIMVIISQLRMNIGFTSKFEPKVMSGGLALKFYSHLLIWTSQKESIFLKKKVGSKERKYEQGTILSIKVKRSRLTGRKRIVFVPLYHSAGIDNTGSMIDFLVNEGHWKKSKGIIFAKELRMSGDREHLVQMIEMGDQENELKQVVSDVWNGIEEMCSVKRKQRYE